MSNPGNREPIPLGENERLVQAQAYSQQNPAHAEGWNRLALLTAASGDLPAAVGHHERAIALDPENLGFQLDLGNTLALMGQTAGAIESYGKVLKRDPHAAVAWNNLGNLFVSLRAVEDAVTCYQTAATLEADSSTFRYNLGRSLDIVGRHEEAVSSLVRALELNINHRDSWTNLGNAYQHLGRFDKALACFDRALELSLEPAEQAEQRVNRAMILLSTGRFEEGWKAVGRHGPSVHTRKERGTRRSGRANQLRGRESSFTPNRAMETPFNLRASFLR
jgi:tetratricopeptide (TPR) repeat protein